MNEAGRLIKAIYGMGWLGRMWGKSDYRRAANPLPHQGKQECARRRRQIAKGMLRL